MSVNVSISSGLNGKLTNVVVGRTRLHFSYETLVAYRKAGEDLVISENVWGTTTGKHLNAINPDKSIRIPYEKFIARANAELDF